MPDNADYNWDDPDFDTSGEYEGYGADSGDSFGGEMPDEDYVPPFSTDIHAHTPPADDRDDVFERRTFDTGSFRDGVTGADDDDDRPVRMDPPRVARTGGAAAMSLDHPLARTRYATPARPKAPAAWWVTLRTLLIVGITAVLVSTIFSLWTRPDFFSDEFRAGLNQVQATQRVISIQPSPLPTETRQIRIGIVAGHSGQPRDDSFEVDPGAVCPDGLTELSINQAVAREVVAELRRLEYEVDLLEEFDERLIGYQADVLVSIHANDCQDYGPAGTGFSAASASARQTTRGEDEFLLECLIDQYSQTTGLPRHGGITYDMTSYHTFGEVAVDTPTAIIELGFMNLDRLMLTTQQPLLAQGVVNGILCFLQPDDYTGG